MTTDIVSLTAIQSTTSASPFDSIRRYRADGSEYWSARELMRLLGIKNWQKFLEGAIFEAIENLESFVDNVSNHSSSVEMTLPSGQKGLDYNFSRIGCYHVTLACDSRGKPNVKAARQYFVTKTREAEVLIPAQSERIVELQLELELERERNKRIDRQDSMLTIHGKQVVLALAGCSDAIVREEVKVTEVINLNTGSTEVFLSADQLKTEVLKRTGQKVKSLKQFADDLRKAGRDDLLIAVTRQATSEYVKPAHLDEAIAIVYGKYRQGLIGQ